jgi:hypothetical protein
MSELSKVDIYRQIDVLRQSLLDLTMRNQLLNFRPRTMTVEVKDAELAEIYDRLVLKKTKRKLLQFIPRGETVLSGTEQEEETYFEKKEIGNVISTDDEAKLDRESEFSVDKANQISDSSLTEATGNIDDDKQLPIADSEEDQLSEKVSAADFDDNADETMEDNAFTDISQPTSSKDELTGEQTSLLWESPSLDQEPWKKIKKFFYPLI